jgi:hypothetical protein
MTGSPFYKVEIFAPEEIIDEVLNVLAEAHAGEIGNYIRCASVSEVQGQWFAQLFTGVEYKIEVNCREEFLVEAIQAVRGVHPYEEPVINVFPLANARYGGTI